MSLLEAPKINPKPRRRETEKLEKQLVDAEYTEFFSRFSKDDLKSFAFFDDIPGLTNRNAFRLQKSGDKNNQCFDSVYFKQLSKYNLKDRNTTKPTTQSSKKPPLTRKQLRRMQINTAREKRYFVQLGKITNDDETRPNLKLNSTLSDKMWLYLEMNKTSSSSLNIESNVDRTGDFMKYLNENKSDEAKWLEFVDYQAILAKKQSLNPSALFEKKKAIFERAIQENSASFRLKIELVKLKANSIEFTGIYNAFETIDREFYMLLSSESLKLNVKKVI